jgi:hypothetical protein
MLVVITLDRDPQQRLTLPLRDRHLDGVLLIEPRLQGTRVSAGRAAATICTKNDGG